MSDPTTPSADRQRQLEEAMAAYLMAADAGRAPDAGDFLASFPDMRAELEAFLTDRAGLARLVEPLRGAPVQAGKSQPEATLATAPASMLATVGPTGATGDRTADAAEPTRTVSDAPEATGHPSEPTRIRYFGDYEIVKELGRGGMGIVYKARQVSLNRPVALKMIKAGVLASDDELRRFHNEAEAVALLDHPGIIPIHEVGEHDGQRYFSMKLVAGGSLAERLANYKDDPKAAAAVLAEVAEAVHHAHMRGILHRDLKPANILVDDQGHAHVTDFGLARKVEGDSELTASGAILGTPSYMAPEQASGRRGSITTATDVYGLGSVLYALLTGRAPFVGDGVVDTLTMVKQQLPEPPRKVNAEVPRDLEVICLKCLEKDPRRRYASAQAMADDLRAWLESRPIVARRVGIPTRFRLWCRRRPAVAALAAAVVVALVGGTAAVIVVQAKANAELRAANIRERQRFGLAMQAIKTFHTGVSEDFLLKEEQFKEVRDRLLKSASDFYTKLGAMLGKETDPASRRALGQASYEAAELTVKVGQIHAALAAHRKVLAYWESLAREPNAGAELKVDLGRSVMVTGGLLCTTGQTDAGLAELRRAEQLLADQARSNPAAARYALATCRNWLGAWLQQCGRHDEALAALRMARAGLEALPAGETVTTESQSELCRAIGSIGYVLYFTGHPEEGVAEYRAALAIWQKLADDQPALPMLLANLAYSHKALGFALGQTGHLAEAVAEYRAAILIQRKLTEDQPAVTIFRSALAEFHQEIGSRIADLGHASEGLVDQRAALLIRQKLADDHPGVARFRDALARNQHSIGIRLARVGRPGEAMGSYRQELAIVEQLIEQSPGIPEYRSQLANAANDAVGALMASRQTHEARALCQRAMAINEALALANPRVSMHTARLAESLMRMGQVRWADGDAVSAAADWRRAIAMFAGLSHRRPEVQVHEACCHAGLAGLGGVAGSGISPAIGRAEAETAMDLLRGAVESGVHDLGWFRNDALFDPIRNRPDFQMLLLDLALPEEPFAPRPEDRAVAAIRP